MAKKVTLVASVTGTGSTTTLTETSFGTIDGAIIFISGCTADDTDTASHRESIGFWDGTNFRGQCTSDRDNVDTSAAYSHIQNDKIRILALDGTLEAEGTVSSTTNGVSIAWDTGEEPVNSYKCEAILFGGGVTVEVGDLSCSSTINGTASWTGGSATPDVVLMGWDRLGSYPYTATTDRRQHLGVAINDGSATQASVANHSDGARIKGEYECRAELGGYVVNAVNPESTQELTAFNSDGFTLTNREGTQNNRVFFLCLSGIADAYIDTGFDTSGTTGSTTITGSGFTPDFALSARANALADGSLYTSRNGGGTIGMTDGTTEVCHSHFGDDGSQVTDVGSRHATNFLDSYRSGTEVYTATFTSFDSNGMTVNLTTADDSLGWILMLQMEAGGDETVSFNSKTVSVSGQSFTSNDATSLAFNSKTVAVAGQGFTSNEATTFTFNAKTVSANGQTFTTNDADSITFGTKTVSIAGQTFTLIENDSVAFSVKTVSIAGQTFVANEGTAESASFNAKTIAISGQAFTTNDAESVAFNAKTVAVAGQSFTSNDAEIVSFNAESVSITTQAFSIDVAFAFNSASVAVQPQSFTANEGASDTVSFNAKTVGVSGQSFTTNDAIAYSFNSKTVAVATQAFTSNEAETVSFNSKTIAVSEQAFTTNDADSVTFGSKTVTATGQSFTTVEAESVAFNEKTISVVPQAFTIDDADSIGFNVGGVGIAGQPFTLTSSQVVAFNEKTIAIAGQVMTIVGVNAGIDYLAGVVSLSPALVGSVDVQYQLSGEVTLNTGVTNTPILVGVINIYPSSGGA